MKKNDFSTTLGEKYIKVCMWMPWVALILLIGATLIGAPYKELIICGVSVGVVLNAIYLGYRFVVYIQDKNKKGFKN